MALNPGQTLQDRIRNMQAYLDEGFIPSTWCAEYGGELAGSAAIIACDMDTHPNWSPWLASVYVTPRFRRRGIASQLVRQVCKQAAVEGFEELYLFTRDQQVWYQKLGWQPRLAEHYRGHDVTVMKYPTPGHLY